MEQLISHSAVGILLSVGKYTGYSYMSLLLSDCPSVLSSLYPLFLFMISTPHALQGLIVYKRKFYNICADGGCLWKLTKISTMPKNHHRRMSVEMDKVSMNAQRMKQRRVSVETENPSLGGYLHRRRWSSDSIHHFTEALDRKSVV